MISAALFQALDKNSVKKTDYKEKWIYLKEKYDIIIISLIQIYNNQHRNGE